MKKVIVGDIVSWIVLNALFLLILRERFDWLIFPVFSAIGIGLISLLMYAFQKKKSFHSA